MFDTISRLGKARELILFLAVMLPAWGCVAAPVTDLRVLIDVSGSMKQNDPLNLRAPAMRLLVGLVPNGSRAGVWTFGKYVTATVPVGTVDAAWKRKAGAAADGVHSRSLFTNIEAAVARATEDWTEPDAKSRRSLILLTDGIVDVPEGPEASSASRQRLIKEILPALKKARVTVHAIGLSENADNELLKGLAVATDGGYLEVDSAERLQRSFLQLFEKSSPPDTLPILKNRFSVDGSVSDATIVVFRAPESPPTEIVSPSGQIWSAASHPDSVSWHADEGYDLITVKQPPSGEWQLKAEMDPDNRVMVVTNLRLKVDDLPNNLLLGDGMEVKARLLEDDKTITKPEFLAITRLRLLMRNEAGEISAEDMLDDGQAPDVLKGDGVFGRALWGLDKPGRYDIKIRASSETFKREFAHSINIHGSPATMSVDQLLPGGPFTVQVKPRLGMVRPDTLSVQVEYPDGTSIIVPQTSEEEWSMEVPAEFAGKTIRITMVGSRHDNSPVKMTFEQELAKTEGEAALALPEPEPEPEPAPESQPEPEDAEDAEAAEEPESVDEGPSTDIEAGAEDFQSLSEADTEEEPSAEEGADEGEAEAAAGEEAVEGQAEPGKKKFDWTMLLILIVGVNVVVIGGGLVVYLLMRRKTKKPVAVDDEEGEETPADDEDE